MLIENQQNANPDMSRTVTDQFHLAKHQQQVLHQKLYNSQKQLA